MATQYSYCVIFLATFGAFLAATVVGWSSPMMEKLKELDDNPLERKITSSESSWLSSLAILGSSVGCITVSMLGNKFGRKTVLISGGVAVLISYLTMTWTKTVYQLLIGRLFTGFGVGVIFSTLPIYFGEMAEAKNRGIISTSIVIFMNGGMIYSSIAGAYFSYLWFHLTLVAFSAIYTILLFIYGTETPYYMIRSDRSKAERILMKLRGYGQYDETLDQMEESLHTASKVSFMEILNSKSTIKTLIIGIGGITFAQLTGTSIMVAYTQTILKDAGVSIAPEDGPIILSIIQFVTSIIVCVVADKFPRKFLLAISHAGISFSQIPLGVYFNLKNSNYEGIEKISWLPLICMIIYAVMYCIGVGPILMTFLGELFAPKVKNAVVSWLIAYNLLGNFLMTFLYNDLESAMGKDYLLWISSACGFVAVVFVMLVMVETKGKTLQEIQDELNHRYNSPAK
ncbi:facilitated trehalose transporter Tret1-like [Harmonia axyridis]|uniref:facilitated trehalose transporter Tret1-like n=1 Tax=Harmonia axyridis TaxID=115357 RepID=UPI001E278E14|nr:facilitated trehalose transporter Tret1-like [Harmonia axyridis]